MAKIISSKVIKDLSGEPIKDGEDLYTIGKAFANILSMPANQIQQEFDHFKCYELAKKFWAGENVDVDAADLGKLEKTLDKAKSLSPLVFGQIMEHLNDVRDSLKAKPEK